MNNKGQTLVLFVLLLPLLLLFSMIVLEVGNILITRRQIDGEIRQALKYGLTLDNNTNNEVRNKMQKMLVKNLDDDIQVEIKVATLDIHVKVVKEYKSLFSNVINYDYAIKRSFRGYINNDRIMIERE